MTKHCEICRIKYKYCDWFLECTNFKDILIVYKCLCCKKNYQKKFDDKLKKHFFSKYKFSNYDNIEKRFSPLIIYIDDWEKFNETSLPKKDFHSHLNMEDITDADYIHAKRNYKDLKN